MLKVSDPTYPIINCNYQESPFISLYILCKSTISALTINTSSVTLYDETGRIIREYNVSDITNGKLVINLNQLNRGLYFLELKIDNEKTTLKKNIKY